MLGKHLVREEDRITVLEVQFQLCQSVYAAMQGLGAPACARFLTSWYPDKERGTFWGFWTASNNIGGFAAPILAGTAASMYGWRYASCCLRASHCARLPAYKAVRVLSQTQIVYWQVLLRGGQWILFCLQPATYAFLASWRRECGL